MNCESWMMPLYCKARRHFINKVDSPLLDTLFLREFNYNKNYFFIYIYIYIVFSASDSKLCLIKYNNKEKVRIEKILTANCAC